MPRYTLVITDADKAHAARLKQYEDAYRRARPHLPATALRALALEHEPVKPEVGSTWTECDEACPEGRPNCRNCGDPAFAATCQADGHCPHCGTRHGIAPASVLAAHGLEMRPETPRP